MLRAENLRKRYGDVLAVDDVSFTLAAGEVLTLLGPNGSGKTTIMRSIGATARLDGGRILLDGVDAGSQPRETKARIGVVHQDDTLDPDLSVEENLLVHARYFAWPRPEARKRTAELLERFGLASYAERPIAHLSGGLRRRLMLARAFFSAKILLLDEPTTGLDPEARLTLWADLRELLATGVGILLTTHDMEEAERLADRVILLDRGRKRSEGTPEGLIREMTTGRIFEVRFPVTRLGEAPALAEELRVALAHDGSAQVARHGGFLFCQTHDEVRIRSWATEREVALTVRPATLGDVYLAATGRGLEE